MKESFSVSKRLRGEYVWATIDLRQKKLSVYHRRSSRATAKLVKQYPYKIAERVEKLRPKFRRPRRRVRVMQIMSRLRGDYLIATACSKIVKIALFCHGSDNHCAMTWKPYKMGVSRPCFNLKSGKIAVRVYDVVNPDT